MPSRPSARPSCSILALDDEQSEKVAAELEKVQADLAKAEEELGAAADVLRRRDIRAPLAGTVRQPEVSSRRAA